MKFGTKYYIHSIFKVFLIAIHYFSRAFYYHMNFALSQRACFLVRGNRKIDLFFACKPESPAQKGHKSLSGHK